MKTSQEDAILYLSKQYGARRLLSESPNKGCNLEASTICWRESARWVQLSGNRAVADCIRHVAVEDIVLSQVNKPKRHRSAREISHESANLCSSVHRIIHRDLQLKCFKRCHAHAVWSQSRRPSHSLINNLIVCNKSGYCSILNRTFRTLSKK